MGLLLKILFLNPLMLAGAVWLAWYYGGMPGLTIAILGPMLPYFLWKDFRHGVWSYLAGVQGFFASAIVGSTVVMHGIEMGSTMWILAGLFLLLPGLTLLLIGAIFGG